MNKVILITGASSGMGKEAAKDLIKQGHIVYTAARRLEQMKDLEELGGFPIRMDVSNESDIENTIQTIIKKHQRIDVLWNIDILVQCVPPIPAQSVPLFGVVSEQYSS